MEIQTAILKSLMENDEYCRKVLPFLKEEYFKSDETKIIFRELSEFVSKYNELPSKNSLILEIDSISSSSADTIKNAVSLVKSYGDYEPVANQQWLIDQTEKFCQESAIYLAMTESIEIMNGKGEKSKGMIPKLLTDALAISFDPNVGHDYIENSASRYDYYHRTVSRLPFDLDFFNQITRGGLPQKTLNVFLAGTGVGKSLTMCHMAAHNLNMGKNVLYITLELAEEEVAKRIDANLFNITFDELLALSKEEYDSRMTKLKISTHGRLIIKEYPTASANAIHFDSLMNELYLKKNFKPDIVFIDYINICTSSRIKGATSVNSYTYVKAIAEELRGLAVSHDVPLVTATQVNRAGFNSSDVDLTNTSDSFGLPATADFMVALITSEELEEQGQIMVKQLKNRYNDPTVNKRFVLGIDRSKMKLYDVGSEVQKDIVDSGQNVTQKMSDKFKEFKI